MQLSDNIIDCFRRNVAREFRRTYSDSRNAGIVTLDHAGTERAFGTSSVITRAGNTGDNHAHRQFLHAAIACSGRFMLHTYTRCCGAGGRHAKRCDKEKRI